MTDNPNYKITFMLDSAAMITVHTPKRGVVEVGVVTMTAASSGVMELCVAQSRGNWFIMSLLSIELPF